MDPGKAPADVIGVVGMGGATGVELGGPKTKRADQNCRKRDKWPAPIRPADKAEHEKGGGPDHNRNRQ